MTDKSEQYLRRFLEISRIALGLETQPSRRGTVADRKPFTEASQIRGASVTDVKNGKSVQTRRRERRYRSSTAGNCRRAHLER